MSNDDIVCIHVESMHSLYNVQTNLANVDDKN